MSNTSIAAPAICLFFSTLIKACSSTIGPLRRIDQPGRWLHFLHLRGSYQAARTAAQTPNGCQDVGPLEQLSLETRIAPAALAASGVCSGSRQSDSFQSAPIRATCDPTFPKSQNAQSLSTEIGAHGLLPAGRIGRSCSPSR